MTGPVPATLLGAALAALLRTPASAIAARGRFAAAVAACVALAAARLRGHRRALRQAALLVLAAVAHTAHAAIAIGSSSHDAGIWTWAGSSSTTISLAVPAGTIPGRALVARVAGLNMNTISAGDAGWVELPVQSSGSWIYGVQMRTYVRVHKPTDPSSYTFTVQGNWLTNGIGLGTMLGVDGLDTRSLATATTASLADVSGTTAQNAWTFGTATLSASGSPTLALVGLTHDSAGGYTAAGGLPGLTLLDEVDAYNLNMLTGFSLGTAATVLSGAGMKPAGSVGAVNSGNGLIQLNFLKATAVDLALTLTRPPTPVPAAGATLAYTAQVRNNGGTAEPGALGIDFTLPAGFTLAVSSTSSSAGWSCTLLGGAHRCTRSGAVAAASNATPLTVNVTIGAGNYGDFVVSATTWGIGGDAALANNTAAETVTVPVPTWAAYTLDATSGNTVADTSGNGRHGTLVGATLPTWSGWPGAAPGPALTGSPGTCGNLRVPTVTAQAGFSAPFGPAALGGAGTIAFWYAANTAWNDGNTRILLDASASAKVFTVVKRGDGSILFGMDMFNSGGTRIWFQTTTPAQSTAANVWRHVAVVWNRSVASVTVYLDGVQASSVSGSAMASVAAFPNLFVGGRGVNETWSYSIGTPNTLNAAAGAIDEVVVSPVAMTAAQVAQTRDLRRPCNYAVDHVELRAPSTMVACRGETVTVVACSNSSSPCSAPRTDLAGQTVTLTPSAGSVASPLTFDATGQAQATLSHPAAADGSALTLTLGGESFDSTQPRQCCPDGAACTASASCSTTVRTAGFVIAATAGGAEASVPNQVAGVTSAPLVLRAIRTATSTKACEAALTGAQTVQWSTQCADPATCASTNRGVVTGNAGATPVPANNAGTGSASAAVAMLFDANGNAPFTFSYGDAGRIRLLVSKPAGGTLLTPLGGQSANAFVVKPYRLRVTDVRCAAFGTGQCAPAAPGLNPGGATGSGAAFVGAGEPFAVTVGAFDAGGNALPAFGREAVPAAVTLGAALVDPVGGALPALTSPSSFGTFNGGTATNSAVAWGDVGAITLTPALVGADYLGAGNVTGDASPTVGRFFARRLKTAATPACGTFTYAGQPINVTLTAQNAAGGTLANYQGAHARAASLSDAGLGVGTLGTAAVAAASFAGGSATVATSYAFTTKLTGPQTLTLRAAQATGDGATSQGGTEAVLALRSGRLRLSNAFGRAALALQVPWRTEYYAGGVWLPNAADGCTALGAANVALSGARGALGAASAATTSVTAVTFAAGQGTLTLAPPSPAGVSASFDLALNLGATAADQACVAAHPASTGAARPWLRSWQGSCAAGWAADPSARVNFGIDVPATRKQLHVRDLF